ncbi:MAG: diacylglycerol kinase family protein [Clostridia bacterium]|nr:diacylglycerol kinase family protein [Clostridia bacterium]
MFVCAIRGILSALKTEKNVKIDFAIAILVIICGFCFRISCIEWIVCILCIALVLFAELINTGIETVVDLYTREKNELAKKAKDISAGAVFILAINVAVVGLIIFLPKLIDQAQILLNR